MGITERNQKLTNVKKDEIINGMERALLSKYYDKLTIDDVAKEAEYSKKTIYSYFKSKDEIYLELLIRKFDLLYEALKSSINNSELRGIEKLKVLGKAYYNFSIEFPEYMQAIINFDTKHEVENLESKEKIEQFNKDTGKSFLMIAEAIQEGIDDNTISPEIDVVSTSIILWSNINGFIMLAYKKGEYISNTYGKSIEELFDLNITMLLPSI
jgi:AcrR family transcriptional regulator